MLAGDVPGRQQHLDQGPCGSGPRGGLPVTGTVLRPSAVQPAGVRFARHWLCPACAHLFYGAGGRAGPGLTSGGVQPRRPRRAGRGGRAGRVRLPGRVGPGVPVPCRAGCPAAGPPVNFTVDSSSPVCGWRGVRSMPHHAPSWMRGARRSRCRTWGTSRMCPVPRTRGNISQLCTVSPGRAWSCSLPNLRLLEGMAAQSRGSLDTCRACRLSIVCRHRHLCGKAPASADDLVDHVCRHGPGTVATPAVGAWLMLRRSRRVRAPAGRRRCPPP